MSEKMIVDIVVAVIGALVFAFTEKPKQLGGYMFAAGTLAALLAQR
jgi:hypothetical protein